ncbi:FkbM family methyltransferase [Candidatus Pelagibacter sp.]|nr:FkbM family methyltransferase [Candidatus Pelagibacter sp.]|tara:strand:+ start:50 stop:736 length:687 start_codon:yes stop_codon:yes gene_type:complete
MKNLLYKISLYLNLFKYKIRNYFKKIDNNDNIIFLKNYFKNNNNGFYIDVGCFHPIRLSNTMFLYSKGWTGINLDFSKKSIDLFNIYRQRDINLNYGVGKKNCTMEYFYNKEIFQSNTFDSNFAKSFLKKEGLKSKSIEVKSLSYLIENYSKNKKIDLIDIDAEGFDLDVLMGIDFERCEIDLIMIEVHHFDEETIERSKKILSLLTTKGFKLIYGNYPGNSIFKFEK